MLVVDMQKDFMPGGALGVEEGSLALSATKSLLAWARQKGIQVAASRCWHPEGHCSFIEAGGLWPRHGVAGTRGAEFADGLDFPEDTLMVSKGTRVDKDAYSAFEGARLHDLLKEKGVDTLIICGVAAEHCVLATVQDALRLGFSVAVVEEAAAGIQKESAQAALAKMQKAGAKLLRLKEVTSS